MVSTSTPSSRIYLRLVLSMARYEGIPTSYTRRTKLFPSRSTFGISKILPSLTPPGTVVPSSTKSPRSPGTITYNTSSLLRAAQGILSCGIYEESGRLLGLCTVGVLERSADPQATLLVDWPLVGGGV